MGASPDGCVTCTCHGTGICEIKCPHSKQEEANLRLCAGEQGFCLVNDGGTVKLDRDMPTSINFQLQDDQEGEKA
ncbi:hypothetical protein KUCAC02_028989 [Chaenocephalus aceratus]|uniref:Uncharacterized protein n=1 Tax=Chaenocephalus aceratus TaxID=36190 RepID=A0ACB9X3N7_CHAAC|nr:hypothetical protein KUCAC02_028989 [Chaenocephalus aceratus]